MVKLTPHPARALLLASLPVLLLGGCAVGPDYHKPALSAAPTFLGQASVDARQAPQGADLARWWDGFHDPLLSDLVREALAQNLDIAQAVARVTQARATLGAATAALLPSATVSGEASRSHISTQTPTGQLVSALGGGQRDFSNYELDGNASWEIDLFGGLRRDREAAIADYQASQAGVAAARLAVAAQAADTYIVIRGLQERLAIAREQTATQQHLVDLVRLQYSKGVAAELQLRQAEGVLSQVASTVPALQTALDSAQNSLDVLLGLQPGSTRARLAVTAAIPTAPAITEIGGPADLLRRRPDLIVAERHLAASNAQIGAAISEYYPKISLGGALGTATATASTAFTGGSFQAQGAAGLRWRLFDFGRIDAEVKSARGRNAEALAAYRLAVLRASQDVEDALSALVQREAQERQLAMGEASLKRARDSSLAAYKGGVVSLIEVIDADTRLLQTRDARAQAATESARSAVASFRALGGGWQAPDHLARN